MIDLSSILDSRPFILRHYLNAIAGDIQQGLELVICDSERRHEDDHISQRPNHNASLACLQDHLVPDSFFRRIASALILVFGQLDADHETPLTDIGDMSEREKILLQPAL